MPIRALPVVEPVLPVNDASGVLVVSFTVAPVSIRRRVTVVPHSWRFTCNRQYVQSKPVVVDVQGRSVFTPQTFTSLVYVCPSE